MNTLLPFIQGRHLDLAALERWQTQQFPLLPIEPLKLSPAPLNSQRGQEAIANAEVACLILAGGTGTRLGFDGPKGAFPLDNKGTTLFKLHLERIAGLNPMLPVAVMTSPFNDAATRRYLEENRYFGLQSVSFFMQDTLPYLDEEGNFFEEKEGQLAQGPNGNGYALHKLVESGTYMAWKARGVRTVHMILVDNALAKPFDAGFVGAHLEAKNQVSVKAIARADAHEKVGVLSSVGGRLGVVEYSEWGEQQSNLKLFPYANTSLFVWGMESIAELGQRELPLHRAYKKMKGVGGERMGWKLEAFIFDLLRYVEKSGFVVEERVSAFAPLKELEGPDGVSALLKKIR